MSKSAILRRFSIPYIRNMNGSDYGAKSYHKKKTILLLWPQQNPPPIPMDDINKWGILQPTDNL